MKLLLILLALGMAGCAYETKPCSTKNIFSAEDGFWISNGFQTKTVCIPCTEAKSPEARFVCFGIKPD